jgi:hypothetical protein
LPKLLSRLPFGAFLAYSPNGPANEEPHRSSQRLRRAIKADGIYLGAPAIDLAVRRLVEEAPAEILSILHDAVLVPAPRSAPFPEGLEIPLRGTARDFLWVPRRICQKLVEARLAAGWAPILVRRFKVAKSAGAARGDRPLPAAHAESMAVVAQATAARRFVIVDDVVTRGATLLACASLLEQRYTGADISGFALLRTVSNPNEFSNILEPVTGSIELRPTGDTIRRP